jgi:hypothetical protein
MVNVMVLLRMVGQLDFMVIMLINHLLVKYIIILVMISIKLGLISLK